MSYRFSYDNKSLERIYQFQLDNQQLIDNICVYGKGYQCQWSTAEYIYNNAKQVVEKKWHLQFKNYSTDRNQSYTYDTNGHLQEILENGKLIFLHKEA